MQDEKIYLKLDKDPETVRQVIEIMLNGQSNPFDYRTGIRTYKNKECTIVQCNEGRCRSFDDVYYACQTYFPDVTPSEVLHNVLLAKIVNRDGSGYHIMQFANCGSMAKLRLLPYNQIQTYNDIIANNKYNSLWSWQELFNMLGIYNNTDLINYKEKYKNL